ncbi:MAG TPA: AAA family ATPase, partial [Acidimicrobiales bacterium]|nr:AAA family ATPase [Acidimicrobiales bacterium]
EDRLGRSLTDGQRRAVAAICGSGRGLDVVVGVAGSGKTNALEVVRSAFEAEGHRVLGTAISGQAARSLSTEAGVESRTVASMVWRLEHDQLRLDERTVLLIDEVGMADDAALLKLLVAVEAAGAKAVLIGDHHQLGAVGPGGGLEALVARHPPAVVELGENVRQRAPDERGALEQLRGRSVARAVAWYRDSGRIVVRPGRDEALAAAVAAWDYDRRSGHDTALLAWRRRDVAALNVLARARMVAFGEVGGPELEAPGGRRHAAGDRVVLLSPGDGRWVTSERAEVVAVGADRLTLRFDDGRQEVLADAELDDEHLDYAYALTVHRNQAATVDRAHVFADGGGRELGYVAMSRARGPSYLYATADDVTRPSRTWWPSGAAAPDSAGFSTPTRWPGKTGRRTPGCRLDRTSSCAWPASGSSATRWPPRRRTPLSGSGCLTPSSASSRSRSRRRRGEPSAGGEWRAAGESQRRSVGFDCAGRWAPLSGIIQLDGCRERTTDRSARSARTCRSGEGASRGEVLRRTSR